MEGHVEDGTLVGPAIRLRPAVSFSYVGAFELPIAGIAVATRDHWIEATNGVVRRMLIVQLEHLTSDVGPYQYDLPDPFELGGETFGRWEFEMSVIAERQENPGRETDGTADFLAAAGLDVPDRQCVARYARIIGPDGRSEVLIFLHECGDDARLDGILERALRTFTIDRP